jgi:hypothetical protein
MQQVEITIEGGVPTVKVKCVKGKGCKDITRALESALGETTKSTPTKEMFERAEQHAKAKL